MKDSDRILATKKELLLRLLDLGKVMLHLDARREGVDVPEDLRDDADLRLNLSYRFQYGDLVVDSSEARATLSFSGRPYLCTVPLDSVFAMVSHVSGESFFFPTDAPPEALAGFAAMMGPLCQKEEEGGELLPLSKERTRPGRRRRPRLRALDGGAVGATKEERSRDNSPKDKAEPSEEGALKDEGDDSPAASPMSENDDAGTSTDESAEEGVDERGESRRWGHLRVIK